MLTGPWRTWPAFRSRFHLWPLPLLPEDSDFKEVQEGFQDLAELDDRLDGPPSKHSSG